MGCPYMPACDTRDEFVELVKTFIKVDDITAYLRTKNRDDAYFILKNGDVYVTGSHGRVCMGPLKKEFYSRKEDNELPFIECQDYFLAQTGVVRVRLLEFDVTRYVFVVQIECEPTKVQVETIEHLFNAFKHHAKSTRMKVDMEAGFSTEVYTESYQFTGLVSALSEVEFFAPDVCERYS